MKKIIGLILSLTIILSMFSGMSITASAQLPLAEEYRMFQADAYAYSFESNYVETSNSSYARILLEILQSDKWLMREVRDWEIAHIVASPSYLLESGLITKYDYYKTVLFDLLSGKNENQSEPTFGEQFEEQSVNLFNQINNSYTSFVVSTAKKIADIEDVEVDQLKSVTHGNYDELLKLSRYSEIAGTAKDVVEILSFCKNMYDAIKIMATYNALIDLNDGTREILTYISNDKTNPVDLRDAAESLIVCFENSYTSVINSMLIGECYLLKDVADMFIDYAWGQIVATIPGGAAVLIGLQGTRAIFNLLLSEDDKVRAYYQIEASVICEDAIISAMQGLNKIYTENASYKNANVYMRAVEMYKDTVLLGFDYSIDLLDVIYKSGLNSILGIYNDALIEMNNIENLKVSQKSKYSAFENSVYRQYNTLYLSDHDEIMDKLGEQKIPITSMSVNQIKDIFLGDKGSRYDYFSVTYSPDNHTEFAFGETISSSNENIIKIEENNEYVGEYLTAVGEGSCTLTFTSYDLKHSTSIDVTVKAKAPYGEDFMICDCENLDNWYGSSYYYTSIDSDSTHTQGSYSVKMNCNKPDNNQSAAGIYPEIGGMVYYDFTEDLDLSLHNTVSFDLYCSRTMIGENDFQINFCSYEGDGRNDDGFNCRFSISDWSRGWHTITVKLDELFPAVSSANWSKIPRLRFTWFNYTLDPQDTYFLIDNINAYTELERGKALYTGETTLLMTSYCDTELSLSSERTHGNYSLKMQCNEPSAQYQQSNVGGMVVQEYNSPVDLSRFKALAIELYIGSEVGRGHFQINFATEGQDGYNHTFLIEGLSQGWHTLTVDLASIPKAVETANWKNINRIRYTWFNYDENTPETYFLIDRVCAINEEGGVLPGESNQNSVELYGDIDSDGKTTAIDAMRILHWIVGKVAFTEKQKLAADVNGDGMIDELDVLYILHYSVGKITKFPVENY